MERKRRIDYREQCLKRIDKPFLFIDLGIANKYGNDFAIYLENLILYQQYFQKKYPRYRGKFFLTYNDQMEQTRLSKYSLKRCKELAGFGKNGLRILSSTMKSTKPKGHKKSTKEWFTINWETLMKVYSRANLLVTNPNSALTNSAGHPKIVVFGKYDVSAIESGYYTNNTEKKCPTEISTIIYSTLKKSHLSKKQDNINTSFPLKKKYTSPKVTFINKGICPYKHRFGEDVDMFKDCNICSIWDDCDEWKEIVIKNKLHQ
ncbi:MAG: hypothetical protein JXB49_05925 [Bacteroidales bacterium]|nr:hypothetical protein [Bacteroidales bacterium]